MNTRSLTDKYGSIEPANLNLCNDR